MALAPEMESPRARVDARLAVCSAASIAVTAACLVLARATPPAHTVIVPRAVVVPLPVAVPAPLVADDSPDPPDGITITGADGDPLTAAVRAWSTDRSAEPAIEYRQGVVVVASAEDRGDDPPYPRSADRFAQRVCGKAASWVRAALRVELAFHDDLTCAGTTCRYGGMEYAPSGVITFRRTGDRWVLASWTETYDAGLAPEYAQANIDFVQRSLARLAKTSCPGEPDGVD